MKIIIFLLWGLGIGDWGLGIGPKTQSPIPNNIFILNKKIIIYIIINKYIINIIISIIFI